MTTTPVIVGSSEDEHVQAVVDALGPACEPLVVDATALEAIPFVVDERGLSVGTGAGGRRARWSERPRGWIRRLAEPHWRTGTVGGSRDATVRGAWIALVAGLGDVQEIAWLTTYSRLVAAENKLTQAFHALSLGIATPRTVVASDVDRVPAQLGDPVVVKPLGASHFAVDDEAFVVWAQALDRDDPRLDHLRGAPFLIQERLDARRHLRVVTVGARSWTCALEAQGLPLDWRSDERAHYAFSEVTEPEVGRAAVRIAASFGLGYTSQDWIVTATGPTFIDLNPAGQWLFLPDAVSGEISCAIADHLVGQ